MVDLEVPITKFLDSLCNAGNQNASVGKMGVVEQEGETLNSLRDGVLGIHSKKQNMVTATTEAVSSLPLLKQCLFSPRLCMAV